MFPSPSEPARRLWMSRAFVRHHDYSLLPQRALAYPWRDDRVRPWQALRILHVRDAGAVAPVTEYVTAYATALPASC